MKLHRENCRVLSYRRNRPKRRGIVLVFVLILLVVATMIAAAMTHAVLSYRTETDRIVGRQQTRWILESGRMRAIDQLRANPEYRGETWSIAANEWAGQSANVVIAVDRQDDKRVIHIRVSNVKVEGSRSVFDSQITHPVIP